MYNAATGSFTITSANAITVAGNGSQTNVTCNGGTTGSITLGTVSGGTSTYAYTWTTSDGIIPAGQENNANLTGLTAGTYNYSVTDEILVLLQQEALRSSNQMQSLLVNMAARPMYHVMVVQPVPSHWEQSVAEQAPYAYTWTTSDGTIPAGQENVANPTGLTAGTYNYSVTDVNHLYSSNRQLYDHSTKCNSCCR